MRGPHGGSIDELRVALDQIKHVASHINAWVKRKENMNKVLEIARILEGHDPRLRELVQHRHLAARDRVLTVRFPEPKYTLVIAILYYDTVC